MARLVLQLSFLDAKTTLCLRFGNGIPTEHVPFSFLSSSAPYEVYPNLINSFRGATGKLNELHNRAMDASKTIFFQGCMPSHV